MSGYVAKVLIPGETLLYLGRSSLWAHTGRLLLGLLFFLGGLALLCAVLIWEVQISLLFAIPFIAVGLWAFLVVYINYKSTELAITNKRIIVKFGFIRRDTTEINLSKVESVKVEQSLLGRMLNFGSIIVSAGGGPMAPVPNIHAPLEFRRVFIEATDARQN